MSKPTFVLAHGGWHSGDCWRPVSEVLVKHGYRCLALDLPSTLRHSKDMPADSQADLDVIRNNVLSELNQGKNVVLVCHSMAGIAGASALRDLDQAARAGAGFDSSVVGLAAISSFFLLEGQNVAAAKGLYVETEKPVMRVEGDLAFVKDPGPVHWFYHDLPLHEAEKWAAKLHPLSAAALGAAGKYTPYGKIPTHFLICKQDRALSERMQRHLVKQLRDQRFDVRTEEVDAGHSPFLSQIVETSNFLRRCAGEQIPE